MDKRPKPIVIPPAFFASPELREELRRKVFAEVQAYADTLEVESLLQRMKVRWRDL